MAIRATHVGIDLLVALRVMLLDVFELCRVLEGWHVPVQLTKPLMKSRIPGTDVAQVRLEVLHVHSVKANDCGVETHVCFRDTVTVIVRSWRRREVLLNAVEGAEEGLDGSLVCFLCTMEIVNFPGVDEMEWTEILT